MRITSGLTARHSRLSSKVLRIGADGNPERRAAMGVDPNIQQVVENSIGQILDALEAAGHVTIEKLDPENKERYSKEICALVAIAVASMPAVEKAMALRHPTLEPRDHREMVLDAIIRAFGFEPLEEGDPQYFRRPANPLVN
jgi:hypothetical protein